MQLHPCGNREHGPAQPHCLLPAGFISLQPCQVSFVQHTAGVPLPVQAKPSGQQRVRCRLAALPAHTLGKGRGATRGGRAELRLPSPGAPAARASSPPGWWQLAGGAPSPSHSEEPRGSLGLGAPLRHHPQPTGEVDSPAHGYLQTTLTPLPSPHVPALSITLVCCPAPTHSPRHTHTPTRTYTLQHTHTPTRTSLPAHTHAHTAHQGSSAQACTSTRTHAHTCSGWGRSHTRAQCGLHACRNKDVLSSASLTQACCGAHTPAQTRTPAPQWLTHACTQTQTQPGVLIHASAVWLPGTRRQGHASLWLSHTPVQPWSPDTLHPAPARLGLPTAPCSPCAPTPRGGKDHAPRGERDHTYTETGCSAHT